MTYVASARVQYRMVGSSGPYVLRHHERRADGEPVCGPKPTHYKNRQGAWMMAPVPEGPGNVDCELCAAYTGH
jgi:hypothetical protein